MKLRTCDKCGSNLDYGEMCDCAKQEDKEAAAPQNTKKTERSYTDNEKPI